MHIDDHQLKDYIASTGLVSRQKLDELLKTALESKTTLSYQLLVSGTFVQDDIRRMQGHVLGISFVNLKGRKIPFETLAIIPESISREHNVVAFGLHDNTLQVALLDIADLKALDFLKKHHTYKIKAYFTDYASIRSALLDYQKALKLHIGDLIGHKVMALSAKVGLDQSRGFENTVHQLMELVIKHGVLALAETIHFEPGEMELNVKHRIAGMLKTALVLPKTVAEQLTDWVKTAAKLVPGSHDMAQDGRFELVLDDGLGRGRKVTIRVATIPTAHGEKLVLHLLPEKNAGFIFENLGFQAESLERVYRTLQHQSGVIVVTGEKKSAISSVLYTLIDYLNKPQVSIATVESPVEFPMVGLHQVAVNGVIGLTFAAGLRALMPQDPDIVMISEVRDRETAQLGFALAERGCLVIMGMVTDRAVTAISKLEQFGVQPERIASSCRAIINQRLVTGLAAEREQYTLSKSEIWALGETIDFERVLGQLKAYQLVPTTAKIESISVYRTPTVSSKLKKRVEEATSEAALGLQEVLLISERIKDMIVRGSALQDVEAQAKAEGMASLLEDGFAKAFLGRVSVQEVLRVVG